MKKISVIICTYNGQDLLPNCLDSILKQEYKNFEVICVDGGSKDNTLKFIKNYSKNNKNIKFIHNENKLPEGKGNGKSLGLSKSKGEIIAMIDQDNVLQDTKLFNKVIDIFNKENKILGVLGGLKHDLKDNPVVRYVSLFGTDSFLAYRSIDFIRRLNKTPSLVTMNIDNMGLTGGNCFFYAKKDLLKIKGYDQDIFVVKRLIETGKTDILIIENATKHYAEENLIKLTKKKFHWGDKYYQRENKFNYYPSTRLERQEFYKNLFYIFLVIPNLIYSLKLLFKYKDYFSLLFPIIAFLNFLAYGSNLLFYKLISILSRKQP